MADLLAGMERAIQRLKSQLEERGVLDVKDFWLTKQPVDVICDLELEFGETSLLLWFYSTEFLCVLCYNGRRDPPQWELLQKTCCFIKQLNASNWNLTFTDSGHPLMVDIPLAATQWQGLAIWEEENELDD